MSRYIAVNPVVCTGCRECEVVCSLNRFGECNPARSAIRVMRREHGGLVSCVPVVCQQCDPAPCLEECPTEALSRRGDPGIISIDEERCTGCEACLVACPIGCISLDKERGVAICCDLCGGQPQCVSMCHSECLTLSCGEDREAGDRVKRLAEAMRNQTF